MTRRWALNREVLSSMPSVIGYYKCLILFKIFVLPYYAVYVRPDFK